MSARLARVWATGGWDPPVGAGLQLAGLAREGKLGRQGNSAQTGLIPFPFLFFLFFCFVFYFPDFQFKFDAGFKFKLQIQMHKQKGLSMNARYFILINLFTILVKQANVYTQK